MSQFEQNRFALLRQHTIQRPRLIFAGPTGDFLLHSELPIRLSNPEFYRHTNDLFPVNGTQMRATLRVNLDDIAHAIISLNSKTKKVIRNSRLINSLVPLGRISGAFLKRMHFTYRGSKGMAKYGSTKKEKKKLKMFGRIGKMTTPTAGHFLTQQDVKNRMTINFGAYAITGQKYPLRCRLRLSVSTRGGVNRRDSRPDSDGDRLSGEIAAASLSLGAVLQVILLGHSGSCTQARASMSFIVNTFSVAPKPINSICFCDAQGSGVASDSCIFASVRAPVNAPPPLFPTLSIH